MSEMAKGYVCKPVKTH